MAKNFRFPLYSLETPDHSRAFFLTGQSRGQSDKPPRKSLALMPLFTSKENAVLYIQRSGDDCGLVTFTNPKLLVAYCRSPPGHYPVPQFAFILDPISPDIGEYLAMDREPFLAELEEGSK